MNMNVEGKYVKSVLGEFSSGASLCPNKRSSVWFGGLLFTSPPAVGYGSPSSGSDDGACSCKL